MRNNIFCSLVLFGLLLTDVGTAWAQDKEKNEDIPQEEMPIHEREVNDSAIEELGELPGKIVTFPIKLFFKGVSKTIRFIDTRAIVLRITDWLTNEDGTRKVRPSFTPMTGGGLTFIQNNLFKPGMKLRAVGSMGIRTRNLFYIGLRDQQLFSAKFGLQLQGFYKRLPDEDFFGIGNNSLKMDGTNYLHEESNFGIELLSNPFARVILSAGFAFSNVNILDGKDPRTPSTPVVFASNQVPGLFGADMWCVIFRLYSDTRNRTGNPTKGGETYLSYEFSSDLEGREFGFRKLIVDLRQNIHLFFNRVLAVKVRTEITDNNGGRKTPFFRLSGLGGRDVFRGYRPSRFRDKDLMVAGAEYRFPVHGMWDALIFAEEGRVFSDIFDEFSLHGFKYALGGGFRIRSGEGNLVALIEIAKSDEGINFYFELNRGLRRF